MSGGGRTSADPNELDLGAALAELDTTNPKATSVVRAYLARLHADGPLDRLLQVAVDPVWRAAIEAVEVFNTLKARELVLEEKKIEATTALTKAYAARTALWQDMVLPKVMPSIGVLLVVLVAWIAMLLGVQVPAGPTAP